MEKARADVTRASITAETQARCSVGDVLFLAKVSTKWSTIRRNLLADSTMKPESRSSLHSLMSRSTPFQAHRFLASERPFWRPVRLGD